MSYVLTVLACLLALPITILFFEVLAALLLSPTEAVLSAKNERWRLAVVIPAHNESAGILSTINNIKRQLKGRDRLVVVADNCTDHTARIASAAGAEVIERHEREKVGKGYALDFAIKHLASDPPDVVIFIDADCSLSDDAIDTLARASRATHRPVQALDLMTAPTDSSVNYRVAEFAWRVKNHVRPMGLNALKLPCQLMGTGMAFPWNVIRPAALASGALAEDLHLGLELAQAGYPPLFCPLARVTSRFPSSTEGARSQRKRWEEGHIRLIIATAPRFIAKSIMTGNLALFSLSLDSIVPPLSLLAMLTVAMFFITGLATLLGASATAFIITASCFLALACSVFLSWRSYGRDLLPPRFLFLVVTFVLAKLPLYRRIFSTRSSSTWVRTDRSDENSSQR